jgi:tetratricopeptide (TPR) repeat protein
MDPANQEKLNAARSARVALDYEAAKGLYEGILAVDPHCAEANHGLGFVLMMGFGEFDEGLTYLEKAVGLAPANQSFVLDLGKSHAMLGEDEKAKPLFERVVELGPDTREGQEALKQLQYY